MKQIHKMEEPQPKGSVHIPPPVIISPIPAEIDCTDIHMQEDTCVVNAYLVAHKYPEVGVVEGLILIQDSDNALLAVPHVWNKMGDVHFDATNEKCWDNRKKTNNVEGITYFFIKMHAFEEMQRKGTFEFCFETTEHVAAIKDALFNQHLSKN